MLPLVMFLPRNRPMLPLAMLGLVISTVAVAPPLPLVTCSCPVSEVVPDADSAPPTTVTLLAVTLLAPTATVDTLDVRTLLFAKVLHATLLALIAASVAEPTTERVFCTVTLL